jgi:secreted Zn-dependent insulinase-like peptidase
MIVLQITMVGYNDKMRTLLETVIGKIAAFEVKVDRFVVIKVMTCYSLQTFWSFLMTQY